MAHNSKKTEITLVLEVVTELEDSFSAINYPVGKKVKVSLDYWKTHNSLTECVGHGMFAYLPFTDTKVVEVIEKVTEVVTHSMNFEKFLQ